MMKSFLSLCFTLLPFGILSTPLSATPLQNTLEHDKSFLLTTYALSNHHYRQQDIEKTIALSYQDYLDALDPWHLYFTREDVDEFKALYPKSLSVDNPLITPFAIYNRYLERAKALHQWSLERLEQPLDLTRTDTITFPDLSDHHTQRPYFANLSEAQTYQEKRLTDQIIRLMLSGKSEEKAVSMLKRRYQSALKGLEQITAQDAFDVYMNVIASRFDPHTTYFSPRESKDFDINMSLSLEGIGAVLSQQDEKLLVRELIKGGPAERGGVIQVKDQILGVAQGADGEMVDVVGWRLDKAVDLIRGKKGSTVRLLLESEQGNIREVSVERDRVKLEEQAASSTVESVTLNGKTYRLGVITLPSFYMDFDAAAKGDKDYRSTSRDVKALLEKLKKEHVDGVVLDLRSNGGGSLQEAIATVGLFIDHGAVVIVDNKKGRQVESDKDKGVSYDGPLAVLVDQNSASASEIFSAAIQDYQRGIVIGSTTHGKGTVQSMVALNRFASGADRRLDLGSLKFTNATFHRVTGDSTQLAGVSPDIRLPVGYNPEKQGERSTKYPLEWHQVKPASIQAYKLINDSMRQVLWEKHQERMENLPSLQRWQSHLADNRQLLEENTWSLNLEQRQALYQSRKESRKAYEASQRESIPPLKRDDKALKALETANLFREEDDEKADFVPDVAMFESLNIVHDYLSLLTNKLQ
ncbi:MAG: carboxy terminal-processing peptidase [Cardiobacteriaceae bacterium]|nr:carboxy terminal-processing peptidase [Cardiobacteriaceae bacterium]